MANGNNHFETSLFNTADRLRKNIDAAEYKNVVLGLIFLKYISDSFQELYERLDKDEFSDPEDRDEYLAENVFFVPKDARWKNLQVKAKLPEIGVAIDEAMSLIEKENSELKNVLPKVYAKPNLDKASLGQLIDVISDIELKAEHENSKDLLGRVYEYFLGEFASAEGKKGGQFYTPKSIVKLMVEMIEPYKGRVYDPACGSGGMFVMSEKFVQEHQGNIQDITIYGQESNQTTWKLSKMNLAIRNINSQFVVWNTEGSFLKDAHPDLKADYILANPPFNQSEWGQEILIEDGRWKYGVPPKGNANFAWMQHMLYHLAPDGVMATVLANGSLSSNTAGEGDIRKNIVKAGLVDCIVALPKQLFYNTGIPATIWILRRGKQARQNETLFIDASEMGFMKDRVHREFNPEDIEKIEQTYHNWRDDKDYKDIKGFCKSATLEEIEKHSFVLTPGRYVGIPDEEDDGVPFGVNISILNRFMKTNTEVEHNLNQEISNVLSKYFPTYQWDGINYTSNDILERLAQKIFKEWFVYFNFPDKDGKPYKNNGGEMVDSELGDIPNGWRVGKLGDIIIVASGKRPKNREDKKTPTHQIPLVGATKIMGFVEDYLYDDDIFIIGRVGTHGEIQRFHEKVWPSDNTLVIKSDYFDFVYFILKSIDYEIMNRGAVQALITQTDLKNHPIIIPEDSVIDDFKEISSWIFKKIKNNASQIQILSKTRDTLLPKLMSNETKVKGFK